MCIPPISTMAAFSRPNPMSTLTAEDERYLNQQLSPQPRPMDMYPGTKANDPLPVNWTYDSAIDLFSVNPADMDPVSFDFSEMTNADTKDLFMDPFGTPTINGFTMPTDDAVSPSSVCHTPVPRFPNILCFVSLSVTFDEISLLTSSCRNLIVMINPGPPEPVNQSI